MKLLMISGDRSILRGKRGAFWYTLQELRKHWERIDVLCPRVGLTSQPPSPSSFPSSIPPNPLPPEEEGGVLLFPLSSGEGARGRGLCTKRGGLEGEDDEQRGRGVRGGEAGEVHFHPSPRGLWYQPLWILKEGQKLIAAHHHDVMTVHEYPPFYNGLGARLLARKTGIPYAIEIHHVVGHPRAASFTEWIGRALSRVVLPWHGRSAKAIRVVNRSVRSMLAAWGIPEEKLAVVSSFYLDRDLLTRNVRPPVAHDVCFCGRIVPNKRLITLIESVADLPGVRVLIIGDGPERTHCERRVRELGMGERVTFLGWLPTTEDVVSAMMTARIFVMNSLSEGGPRSALEAMGMGMPVITTSVGVMPEVIEDGVNGLFTDGTPGDLRRKIMLLITDEALREALGREAQKVLDRFDRAVLVKEYAEFLQSIAQART